MALFHFILWTALYHLFFYPFRWVGLYVWALHVYLKYMSVHGVNIRISVTDDDGTVSSARIRAKYALQVLDAIMAGQTTETTDEEW